LLAKGWPLVLLFILAQGFLWLKTISPISYVAVLQVKILVILISLAVSPQANSYLFNPILNTAFLYART